MEESVAERYLARLAAAGIDTLYVNAGTDFAPIVEAYARSAGRADGPAFPEPVLCTHENLAVGMAHGAYLVTGRPQAVMFHVSVGTANAVCGVTNAARDNVPLVVTAGRTPILEDGALGARDTLIHWAQEMFDQAGMLRELVKWDYELRDARQVDQVVDRAVGLATAHPRGPVYLALPREVLAEPFPADAAAPGGTAVPAAPHPDPAAVAALADRLADARFPVIVTAASGIDAASVPALEALADRFAVGLADVNPRHVNADPDHPMHLGVNLARVFDEADVLLFVESDVPWIAMRLAPRADAFVAQAGIDPLFARYPMRTHRADLTIASAPSALFDALAVALAERSGRIDTGRRERVGERAAANRAAVARLRQREDDASGPITKPFLSAVLGELLPPDALVFNEYWGQPELLRRRQPGTYFYLPPAGGLGWAIPAALGAKRHRPTQAVVACVGDGTYLFSNPASCHHAAAKHDLPVLVVVANNATWGAVEFATRSVYPEGVAVATNERRLSDLSPSPDFAAYSRASGGFGERVVDRADLRPAVTRALAALAEGRQALLDIACA